MVDRFGCGSGHRGQPSTRLLERGLDTFAKDCDLSHRPMMPSPASRYVLSATGDPGHRGFMARTRLREASGLAQG